jgi:hypothetical protein
LHIPGTAITMSQQWNEVRLKNSGFIFNVQKNPPSFCIMQSPYF